MFFVFLIKSFFLYVTINWSVSCKVSWAGLVPNRNWYSCPVGLVLWSKYRDCVTTPTFSNCFSNSSACYSYFSVWDIQYVGDLFSMKIPIFLFLFCNEFFFASLNWLLPHWSSLHNLSMPFHEIHFQASLFWIHF